MVENDKSIKCTKFRKIDQNVDYVSMWCGRRYNVCLIYNLYLILALFEKKNIELFFGKQCWHSFVDNMRPINVAGWKNLDVFYKNYFIHDDQHLK